MEKPGVTMDSTICRCKKVMTPGFGTSEPRHKKKKRKTRGLRAHHHSHLPKLTTASRANALAKAVPLPALAGSPTVRRISNTQLAGRHDVSLYLASQGSLECKSLTHIPNPFNTSDVKFGVVFVISQNSTKKTERWPCFSGRQENFSTKA